MKWLTGNGEAALISLENRQDWTPLPPHHRQKQASTWKREGGIQNRKWKTSKEEQKKKKKINLRKRAKMELAHEVTWQIHDGMVKHATPRIYIMHEPAKCVEQWNNTQHYELNLRINAKSHRRDKRANAPGALQSEPQGWRSQNCLQDHIKKGKERKKEKKLKKQKYYVPTRFAIINSNDPELHTCKLYKTENPYFCINTYCRDHTRFVNALRALYCC